jgi:hypothetical protein
MADNTTPSASQADLFGEPPCALPAPPTAPVPALPRPLGPREEASVQARGIRLLTAIRAVDAQAARQAGGANTLARLFASSGRRDGLWTGSHRENGPAGLLQISITQALAATPANARGASLLSSLIRPLGVSEAQRARGVSSPCADWLNRLAHWGAMSGNAPLWDLALEAAGESADFCPVMLPMSLPLGGAPFVRRVAELARKPAPQEPDAVERAFLALCSTRSEETEGHGHLPGMEERGRQARDDGFDEDGLGRLDAIRELLAASRVSQRVLDVGLILCASEQRADSAIFLIQNGADPTARRPASANGSGQSMDSAIETAGVQADARFDAMLERAWAANHAPRRVPNTWFNRHSEPPKRGSSEWEGDEEVSWLTFVAQHASRRSSNAAASIDRLRALVRLGALPADPLESRFCLELAGAFGDASFVRELALALERGGARADLSNSSVITNLPSIRLAGVRHSNDNAARDLTLAQLALVYGELGAPSRMRPETAKAVGEQFFAANEAIRLRVSIAGKAKAPAPVEAPTPPPAPMARRRL